MDSFPVPLGTQRFETEIKRSRFITTVGQVADKSAAIIFINSLRNEFPDANHHCWAMVAGNPDDIYQHDQSDDGEPKGTAGKPMLNVLQHSGLGNSTVVVTRYFGGIKLGAGGLVRAYTNSVSHALSQIQTQQMSINKEVRLVLPYSLLDSLEHWLRSTRITIKDRQFHESVSLCLLVPVSEIDLATTRISELGGGTIDIVVSD